VLLLTGVQPGSSAAPSAAVGGVADTTKTSKARIVLLSAPAYEALQRQKAHTFLQGEHVFHDPKTGEPWKYQTITDVRSFWKSTLKGLGIRYRRPYIMRHTYATLGIMSGARPGFLANQLGHSLQVFFQVYAKWINSKDDREEIAKLDQAIAQLSPNCPQREHEVPEVPAKS
jgi:integrase